MFSFGELPSVFSPAGSAPLFCESDLADTKYYPVDAKQKGLRSGQQSRVGEIARITYGRTQKQTKNESEDHN